MKNLNTKIKQHPKYKKELAHELGYSLRTFQRRLKLLNLEIPRGLISPEYQELIIRKLSMDPTLAQSGARWHEVA